ncbi:response regulator transcription factor [Brooklawnia sp.]|uniref:response regulator transcription factor n=1 Tax=Brooklawnia sp. TaxID=2699740 RepID=UPI00311F207E
MSTPPPITVVLVDDQEYFRQGTTLLLDATDDITVVGQARTGETALPLVAATKPDVVLMDIRMPGIGGIEATRRIITNHPATRVIVLTTFDLDEYAFGGLDAGASAFILKNSPPETITQAIRIVASGEGIVEPRITKQLIEMYTRRITPAPQLQLDDTIRDINILSPREQDVFHAIAQGLSNPEICEQLNLAPATVKSHINRIFFKLNFRDRAHAIIYAHRNGLTNDPPARH